MKKFILTAAVVILMSAVVSWAGDEKKALSREDFAYGMELSVSGGSPIYGLALPAEVYQGCTMADLGDLRVLNARNPVPHLLRPEVRTENTRPAKTLPFFPLAGQTGDSGSLPPVLHIATSSDGTIIDIRQGRAGQASQAVTSYIVDTTGLEHRADWLEFSWAGQNEQFSTAVQVDSSDDLNNWQPLIRSAALAELNFGGHKLLRKRISLPQGIKRTAYLRISWPSGREGAILTAVMAGYDREEQARPRSVLTLAGKQQPDTEQRILRYHYASGGFFPVDQLYVRLPEQNALTQISVFSRGDEQAEWQRRASLLSWQLTIDGIRIDSEVIRISPTTDRFWRLEMEDTGGGDKAPALELGWLPGELVFMAQGEEPYILAYGRAGLQAARYQVDQLLNSVAQFSEKKLIMPAQAGPQKDLGGKGVLEPVTEIPWSRWLLWAVLVAGVMLIGCMALKLFREMNRQQPPGDSA